MNAMSQRTAHARRSTSRTRSAAKRRADGTAAKRPRAASSASPSGFVHAHALDTRTGSATTRRSDTSSARVSARDVGGTTDSAALDRRTPSAALSSGVVPVRGLGGAAASQGART